MALFHFSSTKENTTKKFLENTQNKRHSKYFNANEEYFFFSTQQPVINKGNLYTNQNEAGKQEYLKTIREAQNNFASLCFIKDKTSDVLHLASTHFGRAKMYFIKQENDFYCSDDLRELLPYSNKKINLKAAFSIVKFGNTPEYLTIIQDIFAVPVGHYLSISLSELFSEKELNYSNFKPYYKLNYSFDGADIKNSRSILENILAFAAKQDVLVSISGGVDSTLINMIVNEFVSEAYPAYYLTFGDSDTELPFAKEAVKNTKADLEIIQMDAADFEPAFYYQAQNLIQPVGESSPISMAHFFKTSKYQNKLLLDGTLADGCYGSRNYNKSLLSETKAPTNFEKALKEKIASKLLMYDLPLQDKFHPRDSFINDKYLSQMCHYVGSLSNTIFIDANKYNEQIIPYWIKYYNLIEVTGKATEIDEWMRYSIFKMVNYAADTTNAKTYDLRGDTNQMLYPFMWKDVLLDQGKYTWQEKTKNNIIKYPLKKILETYIDGSFIYRKKVGLNSSTNQWMELEQNRSLMLEVIQHKDGVALAMLGKRNVNQLAKRFENPNCHHYISNLVISLANIEQWRVENNCSL